MKNSKKLQLKRDRRKIKTRAKIIGKSHCLRLSVYKSLKHIYAQIIDDQNQKTLVGVSDLNLSKEQKEGKMVQVAKNVGKLIAQEAQKQKINNVVFDRGRFLYIGQIKALAEGARENGLKF